MSLRELPDPGGAVARLQRSLARGRLAHAYLLRGPRGAGKARLAVAIAQALNCETGATDGCGRCETCRQMAAGQHPDLHWVRPESKSRRITIAQIREFEKRVNLRARQARIKVGIVEDADCMNEEASNAFLKTLEEPPAQTIIFLLSTEPQRLLPTILSRCLPVALEGAGAVAAPERGQVAPLLRDFFVGGDRSLAGIYRLQAALSGLLQRLRDELRTRLEAEANLDRYAELDAEVEERLSRELAARIEGEYRAARMRVLEEMYAWFGDVLLCVERAERKLLKHPDEETLLRRVASRLTTEQVLEQLEALDQIREAWQRNVNESLALEVGLLKLLRGVT